MSNHYKLLLTSGSELKIVDDRTLNEISLYLRSGLTWGKFTTQSEQQIQLDPDHIIGVETIKNSSPTTTTTPVAGMY